MKKILSVFLAALMLFSVLGVSASASDLVNGQDYFNQGLADKDTQVVFCFDLNGGTMKNGVYKYDTTINDFVYTTDVTGRYFMLPMNDDTQMVGQFITLPVVTAPEGYQFDGWYCYLDGNTYAANGSYKIPVGAAGSVLEFRAAYSPATIEEDTFGMILDILIRVFGAIAGIILYNGNTEQGMALFDKILGALDF